MAAPNSPRRRLSARAGEPGQSAAGPAAARLLTPGETTSAFTRSRLPSLTRSSSSASTGSAAAAGRSQKPPFRYTKLNVGGGRNPAPTAAGEPQSTPGSPRKRLASSNTSGEKATGQRLAASGSSAPIGLVEEEDSPSKANRRAVSSGGGLDAGPSGTALPASPPSFGAPKANGAGSPSAAFGPSLDTFRFPASAPSPKPFNANKKPPQTRLTHSTSYASTMSPSIRFPVPPVARHHEPPSDPSTSPGRRKPAPTPLKLTKKSSHGTIAPITAEDDASVNEESMALEQSVGQRPPTSRPLPMTPKDQAALSTDDAPSFGMVLGGSAPTGARTTLLSGLAVSPPSALTPSASGRDDAANDDPGLRRPYPGLGLGLPFSVSEASGLNTLAGPPPSTPAAATTAGHDDRRPSVASTTSGPHTGPSSPIIVDRTRLVGLGELATPRWVGQGPAPTWDLFSPAASAAAAGARLAGALEDGSPVGQMARRETGESWEDDVLGDYGLPEDDTFTGTVHGKKVADRPRSLQIDPVVAGPSQPLRARRDTLGSPRVAPAGPRPALSAGLSPADELSARKRKASSSAALAGREEPISRSKSSGSQRSGKSAHSPGTPLVHDASEGSWSSAVGRLPQIPSAELQMSPGFFAALMGEPQTPVPTDLPAESAGSSRRASQKSHHRKSSGVHHQHSPSFIAHAILKGADKTSAVLGEEIESVAKRDGDTADALRKLDGLGAVSHRQSRASLREKHGSASRPQSLGKRVTPSNSRPPTPASAGATRPSLKDRVKSDDATMPSKRARSRSVASMKEQEVTTPSAAEEPAPKHASSRKSLGSASVLLDFPVNAAVAPPTASPKSAFSGLTSRRTSHARFEPSQPATNEVASPHHRDLKRGSSSSTSYTGGTSTGESRESTSATSVSSNRSPVQKRRNSTASETSSIHSGEGGKTDRADYEPDKGPIPPVPPLPKDFEAYSSRRASAISAIMSPMTLSPLLSLGDSPRQDGSSLDRSRVSDLGRSIDDRAPAFKPKKWSLSAALGIHRSPSYSQDTASVVSAEESKALTKTVMTSPNPSITVDRAMRGSTSAVSSQSVGAPDRIRTVSTSTAETDMTASAGSSSSKRASILSPRRTPSGIPFFSRSANASSEGTTVAPPKSSETAGGRKSILGLNVFSRSSSSKKASLPPPSGITASASTPNMLLASRASGSSSKATDPETGIPMYRRNSISSKASGLINRKRGKQTLSSSVEVPKEEITPPLPPVHVSAIPPVTVERIQNLSQAPRKTVDYQASTLRTPRVRPVKESLSHRALPTIAGSPARVSAATGTAAGDGTDEISIREQPMPSLTPTRIPRAVFRQEHSTQALLKKQSDASFEGEGKMTSDDTTSEFGVLPTPNRRPADLSGSMIPRNRSAASFTASRRPSKSELRADGLGTPSRRGDPPEHPGDVAPAAASLKSPIKVLPSVEGDSESSAAARLEAARRTVAKTQEAQAARLARRLSGAPPASSTPPAQADAPSAPQIGVSGIVPSRSTRTISNSKLSVPPRVTRSSTQPLLSELRSASTATDRSIASSHDSTLSRETPVTEDEIKGDEEMAQYVRRQQQKKSLAGMTPEEVQKLFELADTLEPKKAMSAQEVLRYYRHHLSDYERGEILDFNEIYHIGIDCGKKQATRDSPGSNYGFDDDRGDYLIVPNDHLRFRYEVIDVLGKGSFGQVLQCRDHKTGEMVAVKIIRNRKRFHHQALVEIKVLENLLKWDPDDRHCVLRMTDHFSFRGHLCIVNELLSINLYELIRNNGFHGFSTTLIRRFTVQILRSLSLLRHHRVVHCDLKPENILLRHPTRSAIKTIDFGSSCFEHEKVYTYIQSRFYRSPEVILGMNYHMAIDMWSLGCILAELHTGYPIFPGETENEQLACIMEVMGMPDKYLVDRSSRRKIFFDSTGAPRAVTNSKGRRRRVASKTLKAVLKTDDELFVDFIAKCLAWDPERRLKPDPAMRHPWIAGGRANRFGSSTTSLVSTNGSAVSLAGSARLTTRVSATKSSPVVANISTPRRKLPSATTGASSSLSTSASSGTLSNTPTTTSSRVRTQSNSSRPQPRGNYGLTGSIRQPIPIAQVQ